MADNTQGFVRVEGTGQGFVRDDTFSRADQTFTGSVPVAGISDFAKDTIKNIPGSAAKAGKAFVDVFIHPINTATDLYNLGNGVLQKLGLKEGTYDEKYADAVGKFFAERYGSLDKAADTLRIDPVGFLMDASTVLSGGGGMLAKAPGMLGKVGEAAAATGRALDPLSLAGKGVSKAVQGAGHAAVKYIGGVGTYTGEKPLATAFQVGKQGGESSKAFLENISERAPKEGIVSDARRAVASMRKKRGEAYRQGMAQVGNDKTILSFNDLDTALNDMNKVAVFKGQPISESTDAVRQQITNAINDWKNLKASEFWTPEGFDALKQKIGDIRDTTEPGTRQRLVADQAYHAIRDTIIKQAPEYARVMRGYEEASNLIKQMEKTLSINPNAPVDTALRKLQSVLRDNVNTSYGYRGELADLLVNSGAPHLLEKIAGQALTSWTPRGIGKLMAGLQAGFGMWSHDWQDLARAALLLGLSSPKLMGYASYGAGAASRYGQKIPAQALGQTAFQAGRLNESLPSMVQQPSVLGTP